MTSVQLIERLTHDPPPQARHNARVLTTYQLAGDRRHRKMAKFVTAKTWGWLTDAVAHDLAPLHREAAGFVGTCGVDYSGA